MTKKKVPCIGKVFEHETLKGVFILGDKVGLDGTCDGNVILNVRDKNKQATIDLTLEAINEYGPHDVFKKLLDKHTKVC